MMLYQETLRIPSLGILRDQARLSEHELTVCEHMSFFISLSSTSLLSLSSFSKRSKRFKRSKRSKQLSK